MTLSPETPPLVVTKEDLINFIKQSNLSTFTVGAGKYDTDTVCECLTCSVALRHKQVINSIAIGQRRSDGFLAKKGTARLDSGMLSGCYICAPCKKILGADIIALATIPADIPADDLVKRIETVRASLLSKTMLRMTEGDPRKQRLLKEAIELRLLGEFSQSAGLPEHAYDFARLQRLLGK